MDRAHGALERVPAAMQQNQPSAEGCPQVWQRALYSADYAMTMFKTVPAQFLFIVWPGHFLSHPEVKVGAVSPTTRPKPTAATEAMAAPSTRASWAKVNLGQGLSSKLPRMSVPRPVGCFQSAGECHVAN